MSFTEQALQVPLLPLPKVINVIRVTRQELVHLARTQTFLERVSFLKAYARDLGISGAFVVLRVGAKARIIVRRFHSLDGAVHTGGLRVLTEHGTEAFPLEDVLEEEPSEDQWKVACADLAQQMIQNNMEYIRMHEIQNCTTNQGLCRTEDWAIRTMSERLARLQRCADVLRLYNSLRATASISGAAGPGPSTAIGSQAEDLDVRLYEGLQCALGQPAMREDIWAAWCKELRRFLWAMESGQVIATHGYLMQAAQSQPQPQEAVQQTQQYLNQEHKCSGSRQGLRQEPEGYVDTHRQQQPQHKLASSIPPEGNRAQAQVPAEVLPGPQLPLVLPVNQGQPQVKLEDDTSRASKQPWTHDRSRRCETEDATAASKEPTGPMDTVWLDKPSEVSGGATAAAGGAVASDAGTLSRGRDADDKPGRENPKLWQGNVEQQECMEGAALPRTTEDAPLDRQQGQQQACLASQSLPSPRQKQRLMAPSPRGQQDNTGDTKGSPHRTTAKPLPRAQQSSRSDSRSRSESIARARGRSRSRSRSYSAGGERHGRVRGSRSRSRSASPQIRPAPGGRGNGPAMPGGRKLALEGDNRCWMPPNGTWTKEEWAREVHRFLRHQPGWSAEVSTLLRVGLAVPAHILRTSGRNPAAFLCGFPHLWGVSNGVPMVLTARPEPVAAAAPAPPASDDNRAVRGTSDGSERGPNGPDSGAGGQRAEWSQRMHSEVALVNRLTDYLRAVPKGIKINQLRRWGQGSAYGV
ncbi:hypothetical protein Vretimale_15227 [Volvox reticuliferus]|uniref:Uncharacterized protein n=2 Tax=Volvox reticuliferus TaxID=1737510 RepID=A0A8J4GQC7_9CHLO|nr:hypothetical protein Vretimale_15227 [Volvox reticuliferus]